MKQIIALALVMLAAACGSTTSSTTSGTTSGPSKPAVSRAQQYTDCMRAHGIPDFPDPVDGRIMLTPSSGIDMSSPRFKSASASCAGYAPTQGGGVPQSASWPGFGKWLGQLAAAGQFSGVVLAARDGKPVLEAGYGMANRATRDPDTPATTFCIASIGKLFTAVAIAQLVQRHKLAFGDDVSKYISDFSYPHVTIAQLLDMTSGLDDVVLSARNPPESLAGMMERIVKEKLAPGTGFRYSNDGYIVLGAVIAVVAGQSYDSYVREHVLAPAGMTHTSLAVYTPARVPGMAHGYTLGGRDIGGSAQIANPSGGASSTAGDLLRFAQALTSHRLLSPAMTAIVLVPRVGSPQPGGPPVDEYTYGFAYQVINGVTFVGHNGGTPGYEGQLDIYPKMGYVVAILTNQDHTLLPAIQRSEAMLTARQAP